MCICRVTCHAQRAVACTRARVITFLLVFPWTVTFSLRGNLALMVKNSLHFIFNISGQKLHDNQIMVSFDVEWLFTTVPVKETVQVLLIKLESDHETKPI